MKLAGVLLAASMFASYGSTKGQISLQVKNTKVEQVLQSITKQTGVRFVYEKGILSNYNTSVDLRHQSLENSLNKVFSGSNFTYSIFNNAVVIQSVSIPNTKRAVVQQLQFKGKVVDANGNPLSNVILTEVGTNTKTQTNQDGRFVLPVSKASAEIEVKLIGHTSKRVSYSASEVVISLDSRSESLDEVVVVGFGKQKKASVVGAISTVSAKELKVPTSTLSNAFAGRISGVIAVQRGAEPGADGSNFWIRGISTFAGPSQPLIFIDGVESSTGDMNNLAPEVIDNFSVLKDASATALYGARGANGVLLITTKRGGDFDKARINFRVENTVSSPTNPVTFGNAVEYMEAYNYALTNRGLAPRFDQLTKIEPTRQGLDPIAYPDVDWYDVMFKDVTLNQYANFNVAGGGAKADYFVSATFNNDNGLLKKDQFNDFDNNIKMKRYNLIANVGVNLTSRTKAIIRLNSQMQDYNGSNLTSSELYSRLFTAPPALFTPTLPANVEFPDHIFFGNLSGGPHPSGSGDNIYYNPYASMVSGYRESFETTNIAALEVNQKMDWLLEGFNLKGLVSFKNYSNSFQRRFFTPYYYEVQNFEPGAGGYQYTYRNVTRGTTALSNVFSSSGDRLMNFNFVADWLRSFGKHDISAMLTYLARDYNPNNPSNLVASLPTRNQGIAGRLTYAYGSKYFFEGNFGYNGSEAFAKGNRWGFFPSIAVGYMISNENFWEPIKNTISSLKIRGSWGLVGNASVYNSAGQLVRFPYLEEVNLAARSYTFGDDWQNSLSGADISKLGYLPATWEKGSKYNVGADISLFGNAINITGDYFVENRSDIFMQRRIIPAEVGVVGLEAYANIGKVKSSGIDANLSFQKTFANDFYLNVRGTFTYAKNKITERDEPSQQFAYQSQIGHPIHTSFGYIAEGYYKDAADIANSPVNSLSKDLMPGDIKYKDMNGDNVIDAFDKTYIGKPTVPEIVYGFGASSSYKKFDASFFFQGAARTSLFISGIHPFNNEASTIMDYLVGNYWTEDNPNAMYPRLITGINQHSNFENSTHWMRDGSFVRLKNAEIGYTHKFARFFLSGQNLLTFSKFKFWDVELGGGNGLKYPNNRVFSIEGQLNF
ncbi:TonB-dependent receptor [Sphingobacterium sp. BN32]|uniref:SusC/RagA family TonB-linked outer membrane protein n=1 Tax=Sphingobacterium sp. BN32 TaxID=3058432 RepID=UPI00265D5F66|nr:TonB-dependent receptor [Sphingobacterium sp. BN32]WKK58557.1 TonB-dependent receptor [Sphingobacterium sp. BN32]